MNRRALLVLGMHRSGTSAMAGLLMRLGASSPRTPLLPDEDNPLGYGESAAVCAFHDRLLQSNGTTWDTWTLVGGHAADEVAAAQFAQEAAALIDHEFGAADLFVIKDPRMCRFADLWLKVLEDRAIAATPVITLRNPLDVAESLLVRNGLQREQSLLLWLRHVLDAEHHTRARRRAVVRYADLLDNWRAVADRIAERTGIEWASRPDAELDTFIRRDLRHHASAFDLHGVDSTLRGWTERVHDAMNRLADGPTGHENGIHARLDDVRREFDRAAGAFGPALEAERAVSRRRALALEQRLSAAEAERRQTDEQLADLRARHQGLQDDFHAREREGERLRQANTALEDEKQSVIGQRDALTAAVTDLSTRLRISEAQVDAFRRSRTWRWSAPFRRIVDLWLSLRR